jgi:RimJ/RimL family protein N-acetyltransferase
MPDNGVIEVGNILWTGLVARRPAATEAIYLFARHIFDDLGYRRFEWKCNDLNEPSKRAAVRFGFRAEGVFATTW